MSKQPGKEHPEDDLRKKDDAQRDKSERAIGLGRREFVKLASTAGMAVSAVGVLAGQSVLRAEEQPQDTVADAATTKLAGPGPVRMTLNINGKPTKVVLEPRVTLLDALRDHLDLTGAKKVCDRATCGACTVIINGVA